MANSTALITDLGTLNTNAFSAATLTKAKGKGLDIVGMTNSAALGAAEVKRALTLIANACDAGDPQLTLANSILGTLA